MRNDVCTVTQQSTDGEGFQLWVSTCLHQHEVSLLLPPKLPCAAEIEQ